MPELTFLPADKQDVPEIFSLCKNLVDRYEDTDNIDYDRVMLWLYHKVSSNISSYTCVFEAGEKVAYYCLSRQEGQWELDDLYVLPQFQNQGIGSGILSKCISEADAPIFLYVFTKNTGAIRLYERYGFITTEQVSKTRQIMRREG